jgi:hypothetical protein
MTRNYNACLNDWYVLVEYEVHGQFQGKLQAITKCGQCEFESRIEGEFWTSQYLQGTILISSETFLELPISLKVCLLAI